MVFHHDAWTTRIPRGGDDDERMLRGEDESTMCGIWVDDAGGMENKENKAYRTIVLSSYYPYYR